LATGVYASIVVTATPRADEIDVSGNGEPDRGRREPALGAVARDPQQ
jgi:hypothetical protein